MTLRATSPSSLAGIAAALLFASAGAALEGPLYGIAFDANLYEIDPDTAAVTSLGNTQLSNMSRGMAAHPTTGRLWVAHRVSGNLWLASIDPATLAAVDEAMLSGFTDGDVRDLAFTPSGALYALGHSGGTRSGTRFYSIDPNTGVAVQVQTDTCAPGGSCPDTRIAPGGIAGFDDDTLLADRGTQTIDLATGPPHPRLTGDAYTAMPFSVTQMTWASDDNDAYVVRGCNSGCSGEVYRVNRDTRTGTFLGTPSPAMIGIAVPEPSAGALAAASLGTLAGLRRRGRK